MIWLALHFSMTKTDQMGRAEGLLAGQQLLFTQNIFWDLARKEEGSQRELQADLNGIYATGLKPAGSAVFP